MIAHYTVWAADGRAGGCWELSRVFGRSALNQQIIQSLKRADPALLCYPHSQPSLIFSAGAVTNLGINLPHLARNATIYIRALPVHRKYQPTTT